jgi:hypothetical protein
MQLLTRSLTTIFYQAHEISCKFDNASRNSASEERSCRTSGRMMLNIGMLERDLACASREHVSGDAMRRSKQIGNPQNCISNLDCETSYVGYIFSALTNDQSRGD